MIKKIAFLTCIFISIYAYAQTESENQKIIVRGNPQNIQKPSYVLVIDTLKIAPDSSIIAKLRPKWIKKIEVVKDIKDINIYGNKDGLIFIYIKKRYNKQVLTLIGKPSNK